jgi:hypothetical protein
MSAAFECQASGMREKKTEAAKKEDTAKVISWKLNSLAFLRSTADRAESALSGVVRGGRFCGFLSADSTIRLFMEGRSSSGLLASKQMEAFLRRLFKAHRARLVQSTDAPKQRT